jgi:WD40 repeat protein
MSEQLILFKEFKAAEPKADNKEKPIQKSHKTLSFYIESPFRFIFGDDIFISYSRIDGINYAEGLASKLAKQGFSCRVDLWETSPGRELPAKLRRSLRWSKMLVLIGTEAASKSPHVEAEIDEFLLTKRTIIPVEFNYAVQKAKWFDKIAGLPIAREMASKALATGQPSEAVISRIQNSFKFTRRNLRMRRFFMLALLALGVLGVLSYFATQATARALADATKAAEEAAIARGQAEDQKRIAGEETLKAKAQTELAQKATERFNHANTRALAAESSAKVAEGLRDKAERAARKATEVAKQANEVAEARTREAKALDLANLSKTLKESDPTKALRVAEAAFRLAPDIGAVQQALLGAFYGEKHYKSFPEGHAVTAMAISPTGERVATGGMAEKVTLRKPDGTPYAQAGKDYRQVTSLAFSPDGKLLLVGDYDTGAKLYDSDGLFIRQIGDPKAKVWGVAFTPNGQSVLTADLGGNVIRWSLQNRLEQRYKSEKDSEGYSFLNAQAVAVSADGKYVAAGFYNSHIRMWTIDGKQIEGDIYPDGKPVGGNPVRCVAFVPGRPLLLSGHKDGKVRLWGLDGKQLKTFEAHKDEVWSISVAPDGSAFATASADKTGVVWDLPSYLNDWMPDKPRSVLRGHIHWVRAVSFLNSNEVWTGGYDNTVRQWRLDFNEPRRLNSPGSENKINFALFSPNENSILINDGNGAVALDLNGQIRTEFRAPEDANTGPLNAGAYSTGGQYVLTGHYNGKVRVWTADGKQLEQYDAGDTVTAVAFRGRTEEALAATQGIRRTAGYSRLFRWDWKQMKSVDVLTDKEPINVIAPSPDGKLIATAVGASPPNKPRIIVSTLNGVTVKSDDVTEMPATMSFSPRGKFLFVGADLDLDGTGFDSHLSLGKSAVLLDDSFRLARRFYGDGKRVNVGAFSADGRYILTGSYANTAEPEAVKLWDVEGNLLFTYETREPIYGVSFSYDGKYFVTAETNTLLLWRTAKGIFEQLPVANVDNLSEADLSSLLSSKSLLRGKNSF